MSDIKPIAKLSARQIEWMEELAADEKAIEQTVDVALRTAFNRRNELIRQQKKFWEEIAEIHNLDVRSRNYKIQTIDGAVRIIDDGEKDDD